MRKLTIGIMILALTVVCAGCVAQESRQAASEWLGKDRADLDRTMGAPRQAVPMTDTGGEELFYSYNGHHYYFQTNAKGEIATAVRTD